MARKMKDSGIEWIGEIPEGWEVVPVKRLCTMQAGKNLTSEQIAPEGTYPVYGGNGIRGFFSDYNCDGKFLTVGRQGALCGNVHKINGKVWATEHAVITTPSSYTILDFLYYLLNDMTNQLLEIPNIPCEQVPEGKDAADNVVVKEGGEKPNLGEDALCHWDLLKKYNLVDFDLGVKITGAGFPVYIGKMARFQRALEAFFLDEARKSGYLEIQPPYVVNEDSGRGTGQLPDKEGQMYHANLDNLFLIPTAEVPVTNIFRDVILDEKDLPIKRCAYSACFRREAGSYGKDVRGLNRLHQFDKVEIVRIDKPGHSYESLNEMLDHVEGLLKKLELPYHILRLCGGDMSFTSSICYDFETWSAAQGRWLEVSSVSNFESYQANRLHCRYRHTDDKKIELCHTLNGSALALPRIVATILENNQTPEGIRVPKVLVPYCGFEMLDDKNFD